MKMLAVYNLHKNLKCVSFSLYTFDIRKLKTPVNVHMDHVEAVVDVIILQRGKNLLQAVTTNQFVFSRSTKVIREKYTTQNECKDLLV